MKKIVTLFAVAMVSLAFLFVSCSTEKMITSELTKQGYVMQSCTPQQQLALAPLLSNFPNVNYDAAGYILLDNSVTFLYPMDSAAWSTYCSSLVRAGFSNQVSGFVKADKANGVTYSVSGKQTVISGQPLYVVTFSYSIL